MSIRSAGQLISEFLGLFPLNVGRTAVEPASSVCLDSVSRSLGILRDVAKALQHVQRIMSVYCLGVSLLILAPILTTAALQPRHVDQEVPAFKILASPSTGALCRLQWANVPRSVIREPSALDHPAPPSSRQISARVSAERAMSASGISVRQCSLQTIVARIVCPGRPVWDPNACLSRAQQHATPDAR